MSVSISSLEDIFKDIHADFKNIEPDKVVVANWVRWKCKYGCKAYGKHYSCPPHTPTPQETKDILREYSIAYLFRFKDIETDPEYIDKDKPTSYSEIMGGEKPNPEHLHHYFYPGVKKVYETMPKIEREAFINGYYKAFSFVGLPCSLCQECVIEEKNLQEPTSKKDCKNPDTMRPPMEGSGIDVIQTAKNAGYNPEILTSKKQPINLYGLLLLE
ncbi:DUF2284 domain-containing protein [Methanonatronarchaeum sp. AMET-Sl]|uniref:DUF2284 domain-containing protein n=1 Tax=Methanonatronarchaeum sp. AMET-Sl TaxID=3037654 RepID=UPI00244DDEF6|nr:DUF2284 domain-containing protein [Methanonatronarchaeum sp. AMET-Sl]WGI18090.1 DUF2284 domain-containing protein [Methanonatronarchaeum sp. AMET-Sl]